jgi:hypothetical protein
MLNSKLGATDFGVIAKILVLMKRFRDHRLRNAKANIIVLGREI